MYRLRSSNIYPKQKQKQIKKGWHASDCTIYKYILFMFEYGMTHIEHMHSHSHSFYYVNKISIFHKWQINDNNKIEKRGSAAGLLLQHPLVLVRGDV